MLVCYFNNPQSVLVRFPINTDVYVSCISGLICFQFIQGEMLNYALVVTKALVDLTDIGCGPWAYVSGKSFVLMLQLLLSLMLGR